MSSCTSSREIFLTDYKLGGFRNKFTATTQYSVLIVNCTNKQWCNADSDPGNKKPAWKKVNVEKIRIIVGFSDVSEH